MNSDGVPVNGLEGAGGPVPEIERVPQGVDPHEPRSARVYDYLLGGKDNYDVDRALAHRILAIAPETRSLAWFSRNFLLQAVRTAAAAGVRQFIDLGSGIPTSPNVHEVAHETHPTARVAYVDNDPVVFVHCNALMGNHPGVTALHADVRRPDHLIQRLETESGIDFAAPVAITLVGVLHYVMDEEDPAGLVARYREVMAPGSYLAFTHGADISHPEIIERTSQDTMNSSAQVRYRSREQVTSFLDGFENTGPGVVPLQQWLADDLPETKLVLYGAVGRRPACHDRGGRTDGLAEQQER
ncbi:SAM-dependent methyltransferase [Nocardia testacea]|uniref:SAM-dependent methyltransferase n=1 Tax=Nocardia testacea TaxID=248551 RepID=UPI003C2E5E17